LDPVHDPLEDGGSGVRVTFRWIKALARVVESTLGDTLKKNVET
jgi:hypothetical protein